MSNVKSKQIYLILAALMPFTSFNVAAETSGEFEISPRLNIVGSSGKPTNDVLGYGVTIHRKMNDEWYMGISLDHSPSFDFERTPRIVGISQDPAVKTIDAKGTMTMITLLAERRYPGESDNIKWFWNLGAGVNDVKVDDVRGPVEGGGTFDIVTSTDTEVVLLGGAGLIHDFSEAWSARYEITAEHHSADWKVMDRVSGNTATIDDYAIYGVRVGMTYRF